MRKAQALLCVAAGTFLLASPVAGQAVFDAEPTVRVSMGEESSNREELSSVDAAKNRVIIVKRGGRYLWASRGGRQLTHHADGAFHFFVDTLGAGYIKVMDSKLAERLTGLPHEGPRYLFMEHVTVLLGSITYWGSAERLVLAPGR